MSDLPTALDPSDLLAHVDGLRRLARRLVRDDAGADDLVQDTLVAAMRSRPPAGVAPRPWIFGVLKNVRRHDARSGARRTAREQLAAKREVVVGDVDAVTRAETHRRLVDEVIRLGEPYRTTLILRFLDGLEIAEIASRRDTPAATVRVHVHRGLALLRERLDARGGREAWVGAFVAAFGISDEAVPPAAVATSGAFVGKAASALVGIAAVASVAWLSSQTDSAPPAVAEVPVSPPAAVPAPPLTEMPAPAETRETAAAPSPAVVDEAALGEQAAAALDDVLVLQLGISSKADCLALVDSWVARGEAFVPVLSRLLDRNVAVGSREERDLIDALVLLAVSRISGDDGVRKLLLARTDSPKSESRRAWLARTATADELAGLIEKIGPFPPDVDARGTGALSPVAREIVWKSGTPGDLAFLARHGDAEAVERLASIWEETVAKRASPQPLAGVMRALPSERLARLCSALPPTEVMGPSDPAMALLDALAESPPREDADVQSLFAWSRTMHAVRRDAVGAVALAARLARTDGTPPSLAEAAEHFDDDATRALDAVRYLPADDAFVCLAHWAAAERAAGGSASVVTQAFGRRLQERVFAAMESPPRAKTFLDAGLDERTVAALRATPWPEGDLNSQLLAAGVEFDIVSRLPLEPAPSKDAEVAGVRQFVGATDELGRSGDDARTAQALRNVLGPYADSGGSLESVLTQPQMMTKESGPTVTAVLRSTVANGREAAFRMHDVFLRVVEVHKDDNAAGEAATLAVRTSRTADQLEDTVRRIVATGRKRPIDRAFAALRVTSRLFRDLTPERLGALIVSSVDAPIPDRAMEEILDEIEDAEEGRDADFRRRLVAVLEKCVPRTDKGKEELAKALEDLRKPPSPK